MSIEKIILFISWILHEATLRKCMSLFFMVLAQISQVVWHTASRAPGLRTHNEMQSCLN